MSDPPSSARSEASEASASTTSTTTPTSSAADVSPALAARLSTLCQRRSVAGTIGRWSMAAAAAVAIAAIGFHLGTGFAPRSMVTNELAAFGFDEPFQDDAFLAILLPEEEAGS